MKRCRGKIAVVTGGIAGIGAACSELLASEGAIVLATDVRDEAGVAYAAAGPDNLFFRCHDVCTEESWQEIIDFCLEQWGRLDILVNNAGIRQLEGGQTPETISLTEWRGVNRVNTEGVVLGCKYAIRAMRQSGGGSIINMSSVGALHESPVAYPYGASKATVLHISKTVAAYCAKSGYGIRCNSVLPGLIATEMYQSLPENIRAQSLRGVPVGVTGTPEDVAQAVLYLASDDSRYVTGAQLTVDGGIAVANPTRVKSE